MAAVERVLTSEGSPIKLGNVTEIRIYYVDNNPSGGINTNGAEVAGSVNRWTLTPGLGPVVDGNGARLQRLTCRCRAGRPAAGSTAPTRTRSA